MGIHISRYDLIISKENYEALNLAVKSGVDARIIPTISIAKVSLM
jgi:hypothetical protein